jgi:hypothetical protein
MLKARLLRLNIFVSVLLVLSLILCPTPAAAQISQVTDNSGFDVSPQVLDDGRILWQGWDGHDYEIFCQVPGQNPTQLTYNDTPDAMPQMNAQGDLVWMNWDESDWEFWYDFGSGPVQLTNNEGAFDVLPQITADGWIYWQGWDGSDYEIYCYDSSSGVTTQLTDNTTNDTAPQVSASGQLVWTQHDGHDWEICVNGILITDNSSQDLSPVITAEGQVYWQGWDGNDYEIYRYNLSNGLTETLTDNTVDDISPAVNGGVLVWSQWDGQDSEIYYSFLDSGVTSRITDDSFNDLNPRISISGQIVWQKWDGSDYEIYSYISDSVYIAWSSDSTIVNKTDDVAFLTIILSEPAPTSLSVDYATYDGTAQSEDYGVGPHYTSQTGTLYFSQGEQTKNVSIDIINNPVYSTDLDFTVALSNPQGCSIGTFETHTVTIFDDTIPTTDGYRNIVNIADPNKDFDSGAVYVRGLTGASGDGTTDDTAAIQEVVDWVYDRSGGVILFPQGTYIVTSVDIAEGITYQGDEATIKRPDYLTDEIGQAAARVVRTFTNQKKAYSGESDSKPLVIKDLIFDGSSQTQGPYQGYELEQAALVFLMGDKNYPGRLTAIVQDCVFKNGVGDGVHAYVNTNLKMYNCVAENLFRGGFVLTGGYSIADVKDLITRGEIDRTGIDVEIDIGGYGNSEAVEVYLDNIQCIDGDFDIGVKGGSLVVGQNIVAEAPFSLYTRDATARFSNCTFGVSSGNRILYPNDVTFTDCEFYASSKTISDFVHAAPFVAWNISGTNEQNQSLIFNNCNFTVDERVGGFSPAYGIYTGWDAVDYNNVLTVNGGTISVYNGTGIGMAYRGGNWVINDTVFDTDLALSFTGYNSGGDNAYFNILLNGIVIQRGNYVHIGGYNTTNPNRLEQQNIVIAQANNHISSSYGLIGNNYVGSRTIIGTEPPTSQTHSFVGDIYQFGGASWRCVQAGYMQGGIMKTSVWEKEEE